MLYLIIGYPRSFEGRYKEYGKIEANSEQDALSKVDTSVWYSYFASEFDQEKFDKLKEEGNIKITLKGIRTMEDSRNVIEATTTKRYTKKEIIDLINKNFPDDTVTNTASIVTVIESKMTDGTKTQAVLFGKLLKD